MPKKTDCWKLIVEKCVRIDENKYCVSGRFKNGIFDWEAMKEVVDIEIVGDETIAIVSFKVASISGIEGITNASSQINRFVEENRPTKLIFDFGSVKFFSSQVLGLLLDIRAKLVACGGEVVISAINPQLHRVFKITNLDKVFRFFPDRESAIETFESN